MKLTVDKDTVRDLWDLPGGGNPEEDVEQLEDTVMGNSRWSVRHKLTVRIKDKFYQTTYSVGATEQQDEQPWEYDSEVNFTEVEQVEKIVKVWVPVSTQERNEQGRNTDR